MMGSGRDEYPRSRLPKRHLVEDGREERPGNVTIRHVHYECDFDERPPSDPFDLVSLVLPDAKTEAVFTSPHRFTAQAVTMGGKTIHVPKGVNVTIVQQALAGPGLPAAPKTTYLAEMTVAPIGKGPGRLWEVKDVAGGGPPMEALFETRQEAIEAAVRVLVTWDATRRMGGDWGPGGIR